MTLFPVNEKPRPVQGHLIGTAILWGQPYDFYVHSGNRGELLTAVMPSGWVVMPVWAAKEIAHEPVWKYALQLYYTNL